MSGKGVKRGLKRTVDAPGRLSVKEGHQKLI
jgi:hypothetical protein